MPMRPSLKALRSRVAKRARDAAEGGGVPAGQEPAQVRHPGRPGAVERGTMRRRLRRARRLREALLTELGALVMEMHRQGRHNAALVERKAREALAVDREAIGLARALGVELTVGEVVAAGIAGTCPACGGLLATDDRFCAHCGTPATARNGGRGAQASEDEQATPGGFAPPPDPSTRVPAPGSVPGPPPDPSSRVLEPGGEPAVPPAGGAPST